jgi:hypothetical protein
VTTSRKRDLLQSIAKLCLLLLHLLLQQKLCIPRLGVVDAALSLSLALPTSRSLVLASGYRLCGVPVADALVSLVEKIVVWNVVGVDVCFDLREAPVGQRVDLDEPVFRDFDNVQSSSLGTLASSPTCQDRLDLELGVGTLSRLNLGNVIVEFVIGVPELSTMLPGEVFGGIAASRLVDVDRSSIPPSYTVDQGVSLVEVVQCVEEDQVDIVLQRALKFGEHIHGDEACESKGSRLEQARQSCDAPFQDIWTCQTMIRQIRECRSLTLRFEILQLGIDELQMRLAEVNIRQANLT